MKKVLIAVTLLALFLSGCSSAGRPSPAASTSSFWCSSPTGATPCADIRPGVQAPAKTRFEDAVKSCVNLSASVLADQGMTITMTAETDSYRGEGSLPMDDVLCPLVALNMPTSISAKMRNTTALMGMQTDTWDGIEVTWSYHPSNGFNVILADKS